MASVPTAPQIIRTYLAITGLFNAALALIWGVNTLFLLDAGLDIFEVMLVNSAFSFGQLLFEVPTGVVADTIGRRASLLLCMVIVLLATLAYWAMAWLRMGPVGFAVVSVLLGLGFTFYTGALDAWVVDALAHVGHRDGLESVFSRMQAVFGLAMLVGTVGGGLLGQIDLGLPYLVRAALVVPAIAVAWTKMIDLGFAPRPLRARELPAEMKRILVEGTRYGLRHRVVRPLMFAALVSFSFGMFGFYSWQRYFLDLLGRDLVWVTGLIAALVAFSGIVGNALVRPLSRVIPTRTGVLQLAGVVQAVAIVLCGLLDSFYPVVVLYLGYSVATGAAAPVRQALLNANIPSAQRATIISFDSLFGDLGGGIGQAGWGFFARQHSIAAAWIAAGLTQFLRLPFLRQARRCGRDLDRFASPGEPPANDASRPSGAGSPAAATEVPCPPETVRS